MTGTSKLFFALWPDDKTRQALERLNLTIASAKLKWVPPDNFHVTLAFLGHVDTNSELLIKQHVADIAAQPFALAFDNLSYWSKPRILCLTCSRPAQEAAALAAALQSAAANYGLHTDTRPYIPHITLSRHAGHLPEVNIEPIIWRAGTFCLAESCSEPDGVHYKIIQQWPLLKPAANPG